MKIGLVVPSYSEIYPILQLFTPKTNYVKTRLKWFEGSYKNVEIVAVICGIGKTNAAAATQMLVDRYSPDKVLLFGVCGAINSNLDVGDAVLCKSVAHHDVEEKLLLHNEPKYPSAFFDADKKMYAVVESALKASHFDFKVYYGLCVTGEAFIEDRFRDEIERRLHPYGVDMETAAVAQVCFLNNVPFLATRTVTDTPKERGLSVFYDNLIKASYNSSVIAAKILDALIVEN